MAQGLTKSKSGNLIMKYEDLSLSEKEKDDLSFAISIAKLGGGEPSKFAKTLFIKYKRGEIDLKTYKSEIEKSHRYQNENKDLLYRETKRTISKRRDK